MNNTDSTAAIYGGIADFVASQQPQILDAWQSAVAADPRLLMASHLKRAEFYDHIPDVLAAFQDKLRETDASTREEAPPSENDETSQDMAREHGLHRWLQGYRLSEVAREWSHLHECLMKVLDEYSAPDAASRAALSRAQRMLVSLFHEALGDSIEQYDTLQRRDAAGRLNALKHAVADLDASERERNETLREVSHDLRGSLSVVRGAASMLNRADLKPEARDEMHNLLQRGVDSLHAMLTDMMDLARLEAGQEKLEVAPFDAAQLLSELVNAMQPLAKARGLTLESHGPERLSVRGDAIKVRRIAQNLLLNALKYTRQGGVAVRWEKHDDERWRFFVCDSGPGLQNAATPLARDLNEASQTAREVGAGTGALPPDDASTRAASSKSSDAAPGGEGIGLSIVKRLSELLDATLEVQTESGSDSGTTFCVVVPSSYEKALQQQKNEEADDVQD